MTIFTGDPSPLSFFPPSLPSSPAPKMNSGPKAKADSASIAKKRLKFSLSGLVGSAVRVGRSVAETCFALDPPAPTIRPRQTPRIAIIGAGLTGVTVAAHCIGHGVDVTLFEAGGRDSLGGIWTKAPESASLELESLSHRFFPSSVTEREKSDFSARQQIVDHVTNMWSRYGLEAKTRFNTKVTSVGRDRAGKWIVQEPGWGRYDAVVAAVGVCGDALPFPVATADAERPEAVWPLADCAGKSVRGKRVVVVGSGAEAVQGVEFAAAGGAFEIVVLSAGAPLIPQTAAVATAMSIGSVVGIDSVARIALPTSARNRLFFTDLASIASSKSATRILSPAVRAMIAAGKVAQLHGDVVRFLPKAIVFSHRSPSTAVGSVGLEEKIVAPVTILANGCSRPSLGFLTATDWISDRAFGPRPPSPVSVPTALFPSSAGAIRHFLGSGSIQPPPAADGLPNWFVGSFAADASLAAFNCTQQGSVGRMGNWHVAIFTRLLLLSVLVPESRPGERVLHRWIGRSNRARSTMCTRGASDMVAYAELIAWLAWAVVIAGGWRWVVFVLFGVNKAPMSVRAGPSPALLAASLRDRERERESAVSVVAAPVTPSTNRWSRLSQSSDRDREEVIAPTTSPRKRWSRSSLNFDKDAAGVSVVVPSSPSVSTMSGSTAASTPAADEPVVFTSSGRTTPIGLVGLLKGSNTAAATLVSGTGGRPASNSVVGGSRGGTGSINPVSNPSSQTPVGPDGRKGRKPTSIRGGKSAGGGNRRKT